MKFLLPFLLLLLCCTNNSTKDRTNNKSTEDINNESLEKTQSTNNVNDLPSNKVDSSSILIEDFDLYEPQYVDTISISANGWLMKINEDGSGSLSYDSLPAQDYHFTASTFDFIPLFHHLKGSGMLSPLSGNRYVISFHHPQDTSDVAFTDDAVFVHYLFNKAKDNASPRGTHEIWRNHKPVKMPVSTRDDTLSQVQSKAGFKAFLYHFKKVDLPFEIKEDKVPDEAEPHRVNPIYILDYLHSNEPMTINSLNSVMRHNPTYYGYKIAERDSFFAVTHVENFPVGGGEAINYLTTFSINGAFISRIVVGKHSEGMVQLDFTNSQINAKLGIEVTSDVAEFNDQKKEFELQKSVKTTYKIIDSGEIVKIDSVNLMQQDN